MMYLAIYIILPNIISMSIEFQKFLRNEFVIILCISDKLLRFL